MGRKTFVSEELHERDAKGSCAMKRLAQLFKRQKLEAASADSTSLSHMNMSRDVYNHEIEL